MTVSRLTLWHHSFWTVYDQFFVNWERVLYHSERCTFQIAGAPYGQVTHMTLEPIIWLMSHCLVFVVMSMILRHNAIVNRWRRVEQILYFTYAGYVVLVAAMAVVMDLIDENAVVKLQPAPNSIIKYIMISWILFYAHARPLDDGTWMHLSGKGLPTLDQILKDDYRVSFPVIVKPKLSSWNIHHRNLETQGMCVS